MCCSVSMPYKEIVLDLIDQVDGDAQSAGAVNTILMKMVSERFQYGYLWSGEGFRSY